MTSSTAGDSELPAGVGRISLMAGDSRNGTLWLHLACPYPSGAIPPRLPPRHAPQAYWNRPTAVPATDQKVGDSSSSGRATRTRCYAGGFPSWCLHSEQPRSGLTATDGDGISSMAISSSSLVSVMTNNPSLPESRCLAQYRSCLRQPAAIRFRHGCRSPELC